ncbi:hypothetical protein EXN22_13905 [Pseudomonas tructae]|uniref:Uncharacterized protein n=1 Tax=Pseudomonas tructae TaxID=2518644 RepID=A0A411MIV2_9PSED|nr:hypothetical protein [Pseudomonas tructae]QBF26737.1 hypothetical protein EXN22_13905 [Pseudomonas tructae]
METEIDDAVGRVAVGDFRFVLLGEIRRLLAEARQAVERSITPDFISREKAELIRRRSIDESVRDLASFASTVASAFPGLSLKANAAIDLATLIQASIDAKELVSLAVAVMSLFEQPVLPGDVTSVVIDPGEGGVDIKIGASSGSKVSPGTRELGSALEAAGNAQRYLCVTSIMIDGARATNRRLSGVEQLARAVAYNMLEFGVTLPPGYQGIGVAGLRLWQTCLSLADPGEGHNLVTCLDARLLDGTVVHIEHIDRGKQTDREIAEAYRLPSPLNAARVRLQAGVAAPCTAYIGRPPFDNGSVAHPATYVQMARYFEDDLLKTAHVVASACNVMFVNGIADCKIAMERMTTSQMVRFMAAIAGNVSRDRSRQFLSAAFNLNVPLFDDRDSANPRWIGAKLEIAHTAIDIVLAGGFEKVTWDGASNLPKSEPIILTFSDAEWMLLMHRAHELGLETYVSAGMDRTHMEACVYCGVDGVGIGTSLHYLKKDENGKIIMGELKPDAVLDVLATRDTAAMQARGRGATALAMLDRLHFEQILSQDLEAIREALFQTLSAAPPLDEAIEQVLLRLESVPFWKRMLEHKARSYRDHPVVARARRRLIAREFEPKNEGVDLTPVLRTEARLRNALVRNDITELLEILR